MNYFKTCVSLAVLLVSARGAYAEQKTLVADVKYTPVYQGAVRPGEFFQFDLKYEFASAGTATLEVQEGPDFNGRPTFQFISSAKSNKAIDIFFKVRDYNASYVDLDSYATLAFHQNLSEGHYKVTRDYRLDYSSRTYSYERISKGKIHYKPGKLEGPVTDILSSFFYARELPLKLGKTYFISVFNNAEIIDLRVVVDSAVHDITVPAGKFECIQVQPFIEGDAIFKIKKGGDLTMWLTNDKYKMPVLIKSKAIIGHFAAELETFKLPPRLTPL